MAYDGDPQDFEPIDPIELGLIRARSILIQEGWVKGSFGNHAGHCIAGALLKAENPRSREVHQGDVARSPLASYVVARRPTFLDVWHVLARMAGLAERPTDAELLFSWNDTRRSIKPVLKFLSQLITERRAELAAVRQLEQRDSLQRQLEHVEL